MPMRQCAHSIARRAGAPAAGPADLDAEGTVGIVDFLLLLANSG